MNNFLIITIRIKIINKILFRVKKINQKRDKFNLQSNK